MDSQCTLVGNVVPSLYRSDAAILEIPLAKNIMSACVRAASRLVESLAPVKKKTWSLLKNENGAWTLCFMFILFALVRLLLPAVLTLSSSGYTVLYGEYGEVTCGALGGISSTL